MNSALPKIPILLLITGVLLSACGTSLWGTPETYQTPTQLAITTVDSIPEPTPTNFFLPLSTTQAVTKAPDPTATPTAFFTPGTPRPTILYPSQSGDTLEVVSLHFDVQVSEITSSVLLPASGFLIPNTLLVVPNRLAQTPTTPSKQVIPDGELVFSPSAQNFDIEEYINTAGGKLSTFHEYIAIVGTVTGAEDIRRMAYGSSISPRILLALIQYFTGWVQGEPKPGIDVTYPLGYQNPQYPGLYQQLRLLVRELLAGYYGWRDGKLTELTFPDGSTLRLAPELNAGTVSLQYLFSRHLNYADWLQAIDSETGFPAFFADMFGDPWERAREFGPLFPPDLAQATFNLPFEVNVPWTLTGGPHPAWEQESAWAALDFAPPMDDPGCGLSNDWVVAISSGTIVRSEGSYVVLDLDNDGFEQTGWVVLYQHIATKDRIAAGTWVSAGTRIGHPSCEGGLATGTHVHIARKYNGEWVAAGDPLPFVLSGWQTHAGGLLRQGSLTRGTETVTASDSSTRTSRIIRLPGE